MNKHADKGKDTEKAVQDYLEKRSLASTAFAWHRFPDARAARGALASQPCDFLVGVNGQTIFLEAKETEQKIRLPKNKISQYGTLLKWHWAGFRVLVVVHRSDLQDWTYLDNDDLFGYDVCPPSFPFHASRTYPNELVLLEYLL